MATRFIVEGANRASGVRESMEIEADDASQAAREARTGGLLVLSVSPVSDPAVRSTRLLTSKFLISGIAGFLILAITTTIWFVRNGHEIPVSTSSESQLAQLSEPHKQMIREARRVAALLRGSPQGVNTEGSDSAVKEFKIINDGLDEIPGDEVSKLREFGSHRVVYYWTMFIFAERSVGRAIHMNEPVEDKDGYNAKTKRSTDDLARALKACYAYDEACKSILEGKAVTFADEWRELPRE